MGSIFNDIIMLQTDIFVSLWARDILVIKSMGSKIVQVCRDITA